MKKYDERTMRDLREFMDVEPDDTSKDAEIMSFGKREAFEMYCQYNGILGSWGSILLETVENIFGIDLDDFADSDIELTTKFGCDVCPYYIEGGMGACTWDTRCPGDCPPCEVRDYDYDDGYYED